MSEKKVSRRRWTTHEKEVLKECFNVSNEVIAKRFNRTPKAVADQKSLMVVNGEVKKTYLPTSTTSKGSNYIVLLKETLEELKAENQQNKNLISLKNKQIKDLRNSVGELQVISNKNLTMVKELNGDNVNLIKDNKRLYDTVQKLETRNFFQRLFNL